MVLIPVIILNGLWLAINIIWLRLNPSLWNNIRFTLRLLVIIISFASLYPFIKLIFPILTESEEDFIPSDYRFLFYLIIFLYNIFLLLYPPFFIPFFIVFVVFSGFASVITFWIGIKEKNILKLLIPSFNIFGKLYFVYFFPALITGYVIISFILVIFDLLLWFIFLRDHKLYGRIKELYYNVQNFFEEHHFKKTLAMITVMIMIFYLFSWPIYTEFWEYLIIIRPDEIFYTITDGSVEPSRQYILISIWLPIIGLLAFIMGMVFGIIYLKLEK